jgi:gamma-glutamylputrescine oxidase
MECPKLHQSVKPVESWYEETAIREPYEPLQTSAEADVCVIGGGLAGLTTALACQQRGKKTILLEAARIACAASGRNGGFVSNGFALGIQDVVAKVGLEDAISLYALSREGTEFIRNTITANDRTLAMGTGWRLALRHRDNGRLKTYAEHLSVKFGETVVYAPTAETRQHLVTARYFESLLWPDAFHIHPLRYGLLLARLAVAAGVVIHENSGALACEKQGAAFVIRCAQGQVRARHVVHCVSSLSPKLHRLSGRAVLPVATYVAVTEPLQQDAIRTSSAISDNRRANDYYRLIDEGRILWGGRITTRVSEPARLATRMKADMLSVYPQLGDPRIDYAWSGLMGYAIHKMPLIGRDAEGQWFATAFGGHGLNTTAMAGQLVARGITNDDDAWRRFSTFAPDWAFGQLGRLGVQGSYWWMQAKDRLDEARSKVS